MPKMFSLSTMFLENFFAQENMKKNGLKSCRTGPKPAQISIPVP